MFRSALDINTEHHYFTSEEMVFESFPLYKSSLVNAPITNNDEMLRCTY